MQVLSNLISNALKFVPAGGTVVLGVDRHGSRVRFSISDTGIGLSAEDQARVFDRFWRGDRRKDRGAGLGLALAKGIIEAHGGEIGVESVLGRGCTFYFILDADAADDGVASGLMGGSTIRILDGQDGLGEAIPNMSSGGATKPH
jgi:signal transduction histidine kinase